MDSEKGIDPSRIGLLSADAKHPITNDDPPIFPAIAKIKRNYHLCIASLLLAIGLLTASTLIQTSRLSRMTSTSPANVTRGCGNSSAEARAAGCVFDIMNFSWQHPECFDRELSERYLKRVEQHGPLKWYKDANKTIEVPNDIEVLQDYIVLWGEHRYHNMHCLYGWELLHKGIAEKRSVIEFLVDVEHTEHCTKVVGYEADSVMQASIDTDVLTWFNPCVSLTA
ncbi:MAG: hypothetical protein MMC23_004636 [Stictis urceolatum]|nr:hypothetical protein [Stictis urceolata]